jgi:hypothetical protein
LAKAINFIRHKNVSIKGVTMKKIALILTFVLATLLLFSASNLTINGEDNTTASLGDELEIYFEYETIGNSATISFMIDVPLIDTSEFDFLQGELIDGGNLDTTPVDGVFQGSITAFWQPPTGLPLIITVVDEDISDDATITFIELNSTFSISGSVTQESSFGFDLPVYPALVNTFYNTSITDFADLDLNGNIEDLLIFFEDRFLVSEVNSILGNYSITIPDDVADVPCIVMPITLLDVEGSHTAPFPYFGQVNGALNDIDFLYTLPDGIFSGTVLSGDATLIANAVIDLYCEETEENAFGYTDEVGVFSIPLNNGTYTLMVAALGYEAYIGEIVMNNQDIDMDISLVLVANEEQDVEFVNSVDVSTYPNPFNSTVNIEIKSTTKQPISVKVYNLRGQLVNSINTRNVSSGKLTWDGIDSNRKPVANGIYYLQVIQGQEVVNKKVVFVN